jgi:hypothetical protein
MCWRATIARCSSAVAQHARCCSRTRQLCRRQAKVSTHRLLCALAAHGHPACARFADAPAQRAFVDALAAEMGEGEGEGAAAGAWAAAWAPAGDYPHLHAAAARLKNALLLQGAHRWTVSGTPLESPGDMHSVLQVLRPIWPNSPETASRLRSEIFWAQPLQRKRPMRLIRARFCIERMASSLKYRNSIVCRDHSHTMKSSY